MKLEKRLPAVLNATRSGPRRSDSKLRTKAADPPRSDEQAQESHGPQSVVRSYPAYQEQQFVKLNTIPRTAVRGSFIPSLPRTIIPKTKHNPTDRSPWFVHTQPTKNNN